MPTVTKTRVDRRTRAARAEGRDTREALLAAALQVFAEHGYREAAVDQIAERAGYSKGALYWHFESKDDLFYALLEERIDRPWLESIERLASSPPDRDMAVDANVVFAQVLRDQRELLLIDQEYGSLAVRDPKLRSRYRKRQARLRKALARAIAARMEQRGAPPFADGGEGMAAIIMALTVGLTREKLIDSAAVSDDVLGESFALLYAGHVARGD
jgi:AcrR family transcriptional regulator